MGKRLRSQRRGKGGPTYRANSHKFFGKLRLPAVPKKTRGEVMDLVHCPGHTAPLMIVEYESGEMALLPAPIGIRQGQEVYAGDDSPVQTGSILKVKDIPVGTPIFNIENEPFDGGQFVRANGGFAQVFGKEAKKITIRLPSKKTKKLHPHCRAVVGVVAGGGRTEKPLLKAGKKYHIAKAKGRLYPHVSGVAMNAIDHPFGGTHRRTKRQSTISRNAPPGKKVGQIAAKKTGRGK